ncbi:hypothetical protein PENNAL_c0409G02373, partial [Penicillium nalgiovense]
HRALCAAENATQCLHNVATLRGAEVRDALAWSSYLDETIILFAERTDIVFASYYWPTWGQATIVQFLRQQRDLYAFLHDQTLRLINEGLTGAEIAERMELPLQLREAWHTQGFYGSPIYGSIRQLKPRNEKAKEFCEQGDLRFAVTILNHAVFADPANQEAKNLLASMYETLGYGCENGPWRNFYLSGAMELRGFRPDKNVLTGQAGMREALSLHYLFASLAVRLDGSRAQEHDFVLDLFVMDRGEHCRLIISNGALIHRIGQQACNKLSLEKVKFSGTLSFHKLMQVLTDDEKSQEGNIFIEEHGDRSYWQRFLSLLVTPNPAFNIVIP